ncbi:M24 family metallopeptidase [Dyadobacter psychrotolerans]|uniref:M24 family metallopeptidase n=1 Tax=Dyadobacter psychrotolerans TaxID=2541721 RepID=A0A4V2Z4I8_9BACT|nr:M24 family metallopeptidase [Dyadobacter psychrotolerans]TDE16858.1 M24 family metallopeptidase [Dyadobacter psychrotolerans]
MLQKILYLFLFSFLFCFSKSFSQSIPIILPERERAAVIDNILEDRFENLLPQLMRREGIDMWVIISREYNEDPVMKTMLPSTWISARRRTIMVFFDPGEGKPLDKLAIARYDVGTLLTGEWDLSSNPDQWDALMKVIKAKNPKKIGLNYSPTYAHADGLTFTEHEEFLNKLPKEFHSKVVSAERLSIGWLETRTEKEMAIYPLICRISHQIIEEAFSEKVIQPGVTTTDDVVWFLRQRVTDLGLDTWFHPTVDVQRADDKKFDHLRTFAKRPGDQPILPGDLIHVDFGITYLRLNTDQQQHAYILKPGEKDIPGNLKKAFSQGNRLQDILTAKFISGKTGNEMLSEALKQAEGEGIAGSIYSHPIGSHGHAAGPAIGMWDNQKTVKGTGDYPLFENTAYSIELNVSVKIEEWNKTIRIMLEEDGYYDKNGFRFIDGRQKEIFTIPRKVANVE